MERSTLVGLIEQGESTRGIAGLLGVGQSTVRYWLDRYDLKTQTRVGCSRHGVVKCKECNALAVTARRRRIKSTLIEEKGGRCQYDGCPVPREYEFLPSQLEFHHLDPSLKHRNLSNWSQSLEAAREEAAKTILVCALCHRHAEDKARSSL